MSSGVSVPIGLRLQKRLCLWLLRFSKNPCMMVPFRAILVYRSQWVVPGGGSDMSAKTRAGDGVRDISMCDTKYLRCHAYGHAWEDESLTKESILDRLAKRRRPLFGVREVVHCLRCKATRSALFEKKGWKRRTSYAYTYPEGYSGFGVVSRAEWRMEILKRKGLS